MDNNIYKSYINILKEELIPALGCTEPIAIAYAAAKARDVLAEKIDKILVKCSGNIVKNVKCVIVPNTGDLVGIEASAITGVIAGDESKKLEVINNVTDIQIKLIEELLQSNYCEVELLDTEKQLHIIVEVSNDKSNAIIEIQDAHINITKIMKNGKVLFENEKDQNKYLGILTDRSILNVENIYKFSNIVDINDVKEMLDTDIEYNMNISKEGITGKYYPGIGKIILENNNENSLVNKIKAFTSAASEARMGGCSLPVVTNSGSGNQGIAASVPIIVYAMEKGLSKEMLYRGLIFSNLLAIHQKTGIGRLSAYCGAVSAGCASGAAITYLEGATLDQINKTITNVLANISGIVCDGAKASCAAKIASSIDAAFMGHYMAMANVGYKPYTGIIKQSIEKTISAVARIGRDGMRETDKEILKIMLEN